MEKKIKILVVGPGMEIGGVERAILGLLDSIDYNKCIVDLFLYSHSGELLKYVNKNANLIPEERIFAGFYQQKSYLIKKKNYKTLILKTIAKSYSTVRKKMKKRGSVYFSFYHKYACKLVKPLKQEYDIALSMNPPHYYVINKVKAKIKIGWDHMDLSSPANLEDTNYMYNMWRSLNYIACVSEDVKNSFLRLYPELYKIVFVFENINCVRLIITQSLEDISEQMDGNFNILSIGRYDPTKNFDKIPYMCNIIKEKGINVKWYIIGYGNENIENDIKEEIYKYNLQDYVILLGKKVNPYSYMKKCDLVVFPSSDEGKLVVVLEAQILGKSVVITRFPTSESQLENGIDGIIAPMDFQLCAEEIVKLIQDPDKRKRLSEVCLSRDYSNCSEINKIFDLYNKEIALK